MTGKGKDGYVLGYFMVLLMVLMIVLTSAMAITLGYYSRIINETYRKQAFYTAQSVAEALARECVNNGGESLAPIMPDLFSSSKETEIHGLPKEMGKCILYADYDAEKTRLELRVTVSFKNQEQTAAAVLYWEKLLGSPDLPGKNGVWRLKGYTDGKNGNEGILKE